MTRKTYVRVTPEIREKVRLLYIKHGAPIDFIAGRFNLAYNTVQRITAESAKERMEFLHSLMEEKS